MSDRDKRVTRLRVPGGWIYDVKELDEDLTGILHQYGVFVPQAPAQDGAAARPQRAARAI